MEIHSKENQTLLESVNPVFKTARTTLFDLSNAGDGDARILCEKMHLTAEETGSSERAEIMEESQRISELVVESRYSTISSLAMSSGADLIVDLPCGYTPRGIQFARNNRRYLGLDLPASIAEGEPVFLSLTDEEKRPLLRYAGCDATNYESLARALEGEEGTVCICTEGLLMYLTESETGEFCDNIRRILEKHGGCWLAADPEVAIQYGLTIRSVYPQMLTRIQSNGQKNVEDKAQIRMSATSLLVSPRGSVPENMKNAMAFLARHGLKAERMVIAEHMPRMGSVEKLDEEKRLAYCEAMKKCAFWRITPASADSGEEREVSEARFAARMKREEDTLKAVLCGRVDTLTAPKVLSLFELECSGEAPAAAEIDCRDLEYISSAGLRVLLIMRKKLKKGVTLKNAGPAVLEILKQTGFDELLNLA